MKNTKVLSYIQTGGKMTEKTMRALYRPVCVLVPSYAVGAMQATEIHRKDGAQCAGKGMSSFWELKREAE